MVLLEEWLALRPVGMFANSLPTKPGRVKQKALLPFVYKGSRAFLIRGDGGI